MSAIDVNPSDHAHDGHDDHHDHPPFLQHHFDTPAQQFDSAKLGMWVFLGTEILFFGALFALYVILRVQNPEVFSYMSQYLDTVMGGINTCVLILSSLTMAMAVHFAQRSKKTAMLVCLWLTMGGAVGFMVIKYFEYTHKFHEKLVWGPGFYTVPDYPEAQAALAAAEASAADAVAAAPGVVTDPAQRADFASVVAAQEVASMPLAPLPELLEESAIAPAQIGPAGLVSADPIASIEEAKAHAGHHAGYAGPHVLDAELPVGAHRFMAIYYCMTGLHGIHVVAGMIMIGWLILRGMRGDFNRDYFTPVDLGGLYWHIVDLVWIFLFPLFYLIH